MNKLFLLLTLVAVPVMAAEKNYNGVLKTTEMQQDIQQIFDMKMFHDPIVVKNMIQEMDTVQKHEIQTDSVEAEMFGYEGVFTPKDAETLKGVSMQRRAQTQTVQSGELNQLLKQAEKDPYQAMVRLTTNQKITSIADEELKVIDSIDDQSIPNLIQLTTSAGPEVGAEPVGIWYGLDQE